MNIEEEKLEETVSTEETAEMPEKKGKDKNKKKENKDKKDMEILVLTESLAQEKEKSLRIQAEMMNFRKRKEEEVSNLYKYANEDILKKLVNIVDNFERALALKTEENKDFLEGFQMIYTNILNILEENEVKEIVCLNEDFDPAFHQAVLTEAKDGVESNKVIEVLQKGYMYKERVLRAAMVKVSE